VNGQVYSRHIAFEIQPDVGVVDVSTQESKEPEGMFCTDVER